MWRFDNTQCVILLLVSLAAASDVLSLDDLNLPEHAKIRSTYQIQTAARVKSHPLGEAQDPEQGDAEEANMEAEVNSLEQANQALDAELAGDSPTEEAVDGASNEASTDDPNFANLLECKKKIDAEEAKQLEMKAKLETCRTRKTKVDARINAAVQKMSKMSDLSLKCTTEKDQAMQEEKKAIALEEKEKNLLLAAKDACDARIVAAGETSQVELDQMQSEYDAKETESNRQAAQMKLDFEQKETAALSDAEKTGEVAIETSLEKKDEAVAAVEAHTKDAISELSTEMENEADQSTAQTQAEAQAKENQLKEALTKAQNDKEEAIRQATEEKEGLQTTNTQLGEAVTAAEQEAKQAADARAAAIASLATYKAWAESLLVQTSTAATSAEATAEAAVVSADIIKEGALDADVAAAREAATSLHDAIKAVDGQNTKRK